MKALSLGLGQGIWPRDGMGVTETLIQPLPKAPGPEASGQWKRSILSFPSLLYGL